MGDGVDVGDRSNVSDGVVNASNDVGEGVVDVGVDAGDDADVGVVDDGADVGDGVGVGWRRCLCGR